ncbi:hypothetical protein CALCODRAFT_489603 [Calocera cornea HHB12733]|uniref:Uncharacterized protein n=1 Tax=Calocera cornea HHB12733 TaxID=1353952 RepID=A0A165K386_9BASI|nr:hypothetical protein CALCODRAFT_489603 [Calocera cornea HHB12733]
MYRLPLTPATTEDEDNVSIDETPNSDRSIADGEHFMYEEASADELDLDDEPKSPKFDSDGEENPDYRYIEKEMSFEEAIVLARSRPVFRPVSCILTWNCPCARSRQERAQLLVQSVTKKLLKRGWMPRPPEPEVPEPEVEAKREQRKPVERAVVRYKRLQRKEAAVKQRLMREAEIVAKKRIASRASKKSTVKPGRSDAAADVARTLPTPPPHNGRIQGHVRRFSQQETQVIQVLANMKAARKSD